VRLRFALQSGFDAALRVSFWSAIGLAAVMLLLAARNTFAGSRRFERAMLYRLARVMRQARRN
jgi:hypothetical protein